MLDVVNSDLDLPLLNNHDDIFSCVNHEVWKISLERKARFIDQYEKFILPEYVEGFFELDFSLDKIPSLDQINQRLSKTDWSATYINGFLHQSYYANLLVNRIVPISQHVRDIRQIDYAPLPDMIHDIIGHLPMLFSEEYCCFLSKLSLVMKNAKANDLENRLFFLYDHSAKLLEQAKPDHSEVKILQKEIQSVEEELNRNPSLFNLLGRFFMWSIEFGVMCRNNKMQFYGAGLSSSQSESLRFCEMKTNMYPFTYQVVDTSYNFSAFQNQFFYANSFEELSEELNKLMQLHGK